MPIGRLHVLTDTHFQRRFTHAELARLAVEGGADTVQLRDKTADARALLAEIEAAVAVCRAASVALIVDDRLDLALAGGADGVHLGQADLPLGAARALLARLGGPTRLVGATASTVDEAVEAEAAGADYVGFGPVFSGRSKSPDSHGKANPAPVRGLDGLAAVCRVVRIPVVAIGGITAERVAEVLAAGAHGIAAMTAVSTAPDPAAATAAIREAIERAATAAGR